MPYPTFLAGQRVTAALLNAGKLEFVTNSAGAQTNATTTPTNATDLVFAVEANARYQVQVALAHDAPTATDIKFGWVIPSGASMARNIIGLASNVADNQIASMQAIRRAATTNQTAGGAAGVSSAFSVYTEIIDLIVSSTAGTAQLQFAAVAAGTATLQGDSVVYYQRIL